MKTAQEILYSIDPLIDASINKFIIEKMKEYAKQVAEQTLKDASEKATLIYENDITGEISHYGCTYGTEEGEVRVDKTSISSIKILLP